MEDEPGKRSVDTLLATVVELLGRNGSLQNSSILPYDYLLKYTCSCDAKGYEIFINIEIKLESQ